VIDKVVYLMRGLPSSGKSHTARILAGEKGCVCETDDYFYTQLGDDPDKYSYDVKQLKNARDWNFARFQKVVDAGITPIIVDRGNSLSEESQRYVRYCITQNYSVVLKEPDSPWWGEIRVLLKYKQYTRPVLSIWSERLAQLSCSTHNVSARVIQQRMDRWQWDLSVDDILEYNPGQNIQAINAGAVETLSKMTDQDQSNFSHTKNGYEHLAYNTPNEAESNDSSNGLILGAKTSRKDSGLLDAAAIAKLDQVVLKTNNQDGLEQDNALNNAITIDSFAGDNGWFVDIKSEDSEEFQKYSKANTSGLAYVNCKVESFMNLFTVPSHETKHILGFNHSEIGLIIDATLDESVRISIVDKVTEQMLCSNTFNNAVINEVSVSENRSFAQKLKEKLDDVGDFKFFNDKGDFNTQRAEIDEKDDDFLMLSNTVNEKEGKGSRYELTEGEMGENSKSFMPSDKDEEDRKPKSDSSLIDWSAWEEE